MTNTVNNEVISVALYIRVSTEEQVKHGYSLESQENRLKEYCKSKNYKIIDIYKDEGKSARSKLRQRTELLRLIEDAKIKKFERIVFWRLDRWFRNIADYYKTQEILEANNITWECSDEEYNTTTSNGRLHLNIKLSIAQNESDQTSDRIKFNFDNMIKNKKAIYGTHSCPLGYMVVGEKGNKHMIKNKKESEIVNYLFETYQLTTSYRRTSILINENFNYYVDPLVIKRILKNSLYYGKFREIENYCEPYITKEEFDEIQTMLPKNNRQNKKYEYLFTGLMVCDECNKKMAANIKNNKKIYRCASYCNNRKCNNSKYIAENKIEEYLLENLENIKNTFIQENEKNTLKIDYLSKIKSLNAKKDRINDLYIDGYISKEKYLNDINKISKETNELLKLQEKIKIPKKITKLDENVLNIYNSLNNELKRNFWLKYIDHINFKPTNNKNLNERINIFWK